MKKTIFLLIFISTLVFAKDCATYYKPDKFYEAPLYLEELIEENIHNLELEVFGSAKEYKKLNFKKDNDTFIKENSFVKLKDYTYPIKSQLWKYKIKNKKIEEFDISKKEYYKFLDSDIANEINENFEQFWNDWVEDGYSMQLLPTHTLFRYKDFYFSLSVFIYGVKGDASSLEHTIVNYHFKNYTKEVNKYIKCVK